MKCTTVPKPEVLNALYGIDESREIQVSRGKVWYYMYENDTLRSFVEACTLLEDLKNHYLEALSIPYQIGAELPFGGQNIRATANGQEGAFGGSEFDAFINMANKAADKGVFK